MLNCDWCGAEGHDYTIHPDAVAEANAYTNSLSDEDTWFPVGAY